MNNWKERVCGDPSSYAIVIFFLRCGTCKQDEEEEEEEEEDEEEEESRKHLAPVGHARGDEKNGADAIFTE